MCSPDVNLVNLINFIALRISLGHSGYTRCWRPARPQRLHRLATSCIFLPLLSAHGCEPASTVSACHQPICGNTRRKKLKPWSSTLRITVFIKVKFVICMKKSSRSTKVYNTETELSNPRNFPRNKPQTCAVWYLPFQALVGRWFSLQQHKLGGRYLHIFCQ